ncbi:MAG: glutaminyl-peptide cyclotransferase [Pyrinomonadaceae bacterium]|nr:glutaminyl-peptide cyclotransferase [Pyrinomonadaceae bacterium]
MCRITFLAITLLLSACNDVQRATPNLTPTPVVSTSPSLSSSPATANSNSSTADVPTYTYEVVNTYPHARDAYTQGLIFQDGILWESTGERGRSSLRKVDLQTGKVLKKVDVPPEFFAEGMTVLDGKVYQLTWQEHKGFIYDAETLKKLGEFSYQGEGWGLTHDGESLIMSDGTNQLRFLHPNTLQVKRTISVFDKGEPLAQLNELEFIRGEIWANIWQTDKIVQLDPQTGKILGWIDLTGLLPTRDYTPETDVLNGIAYDKEGDRLFVTGKLWPKLFEIRLVKKKALTEVLDERRSNGDV